MIIKRPTLEHEFDQIFELNYATFVEEIPQHESNEGKRLVDAYHEKNNYLIALNEDEVIGMVCYNFNRPFSLDKKGVQIDELLEIGRVPVELRLFTIKKEWRKQQVAFRLLIELVKITTNLGANLGLISATTRELDYYKRAGFKNFGSMVGVEGAFYQPMFITFENLGNEYKG